MKELFNSINDYIKKYINKDIYFDEKEGCFEYENCYFYITCDLRDDYILFQIDDYIHSGNYLVEDYRYHIDNTDVCFKCSTEEEIIDSIEDMGNFILYCPAIDTLSDYNDIMDRIDTLESEDRFTFIDIITEYC